MTELALQILVAAMILYGIRLERRVSRLQTRLERLSKTAELVDHLQDRLRSLADLAVRAVDDLEHQARRRDMGAPGQNSAGRREPGEGVPRE